uniref:DUF2244 domain-containing protein n=1 Tax=Pararhizobium sp. IMCC3301 TaxID=3067904 RepID=UPI00274277FD|nr:DUF2244 domain-containing protein [Pararhizobium sp. IMCC3301]
MRYTESSILFAARLTPYRSLGRTGFIVLMAFVSIICFVAGLLFVWIGAWPVFCFFSLNVLTIYLAFKLNYRSARAYEDVELSQEQLQVTKVSAKGVAEEHCFNPFWVRLTIEREEDEGVTALTLTSHGRSLRIGSFLNPGDRETLGTALREALRKARGPVFS